MKKGKIVETGTVGNVLKDPQHEYTQNLIASIPKITDNQQRIKRNKFY